MYSLSIYNLRASGSGRRPRGSQRKGDSGGSKPEGLWGGLGEGFRGLGVEGFRGLGAQGSGGPGNQ